MYNQQVGIKGKVNLGSFNLDVSKLPVYRTWNCEKWIDFHQYLLTVYPKRQAAELWVAFFNNKPDEGFFSAECRSNPEFIKYFEDEGIEIKGTLSTFFAEIPKIGGKTLRGLGVILGVAAVGVAAFFVLKYTFQLKLFSSASSIAEGVSKNLNK